MSPGLQHRVICVGVDAELQANLAALLRQRGAEPVMACADAEAAAAEALAQPSEPHLFIVHTGAGVDPPALAGLASRFPGQPILALLPAGADIGRLLAAQRSGAAQVVTLPLVAADFLQALDCLAVQFAPPPRHARVVAVCGVSGGCGATTVALNLACELAQAAPTRRGGVLLVELARGVGSLATYLDAEPDVTTQELLADSACLSLAGLRRAAVPIIPGLDALVGAYREILSAAAAPRNVYRLLELCRKLASHVILDVPCTLDDLQFETLGLAEQVVLVGVQSVPSVRTLKMVRDTLDREQGVGEQLLVLNRYEPAMPGFSAERIAGLLGVPAVLTVANDFPSVMAALNNGKPLVLAVPHSRAAADVRKLTARLDGSAAASEVEGDRLQRALGKPAGPAPTRALRVLHVEDDPVQREAVALRLGALPEFTVSITHAASETAAVELFEQKPFDLVLLDYQLAQGDGLGCLQRLRRLDGVVPILVVSGVNKPQVAADLLAAGADDFLSKENLGGEQLGRAMAAAVTRAEACKTRLGALPETALQDTVFDRLRAAFTPAELTELFNNLVELHAMSRAGRFSAAQVQRVADLVSAELSPSPGSGAARRALLSLLLRLLGTK